MQTDTTLHAETSLLSENSIKWLGLAQLTNEIQK